MYYFVRKIDKFNQVKIGKISLLKQLVVSTL